MKGVDAMTSVGRAADRVVDQYTANGIARAIVAAIPFVGSSIDALITTRGDALAQQRVISLLEDLRAALERVDESKIDREYVESDAWDDLVIRAFRAAAETRDRDKIRLLAAVLAGSVMVDRDPALDSEALLSVLRELSPIDIALARALNDVLGRPRTDRESKLNPLQFWLARANTDEWVPAPARGDLQFHLKRLEQAGLVSELGGSYWDYAGGAYELTPALGRLMRLATTLHFDREE